ncbi:hypothetical protein ABG768_017625, partial [Culter alburnus]
APASFGAWALSAASRPLILPNGDCLFTANLNPQTTGLPQPESAQSQQPSTTPQPLTPSLGPSSTQAWGPPMPLQQHHLS